MLGSTRVIRIGIQVWKTLSRATVRADAACGRQSLIGCCVIEESTPAIADLPTVVRAILFADVVESVRLMQDDEAGTVRRWHGFVEQVTTAVLPAHDGRLVKVLGDGLMLEFAGVHSAVAAAFALQAAASRMNADLPAARRLHLRIGLHVSPVIADHLDLYGHGVNLAARLTTLAGPDEIVVSADVRDQLTPALDADVDDLGECYVKHVARPVRAFRIGVCGDKPVIEPGNDDDLRATVAVVPFACRSATAGQEVIGQVLAEDVISGLSRSTEINVVSRLSTASLQGRALSADELSAVLRADYVLSGSYLVDGDHIALKAELAETSTMQVVWAATLRARAPSVLAGEDPMAARLVADTCSALMLRELQHTQGKAPQNIESHTLLLASVTLMHRISPPAFARARELLTALVDRSPRFVAPYAWLAKWHVLRVTQGWSDDATEDGRRALDNTRRALDRDPTSSLALTVEGQVYTYIDRQFDLGEQRYGEALQSNPNDSLAWLLKGTLHAFRGEGREAVRHTRHALKLSPLDPLKYYFDSLAATAALSAGQYARALSLAQRSLRLNRTHASTLRTMLVALWHLGQHDRAREVAAELLRLNPTFRVSTYRKASPAAGFAIGGVVADALLAAGVPE
jgi:adenylate cyclase